MALDEGLGGFGQLAKPVDELLAQLREFHAVARIGQSLVEDQPLVHVGAIVIGQQGRCMQLDFRHVGQRGRQIGLTAGFQRFDSLLQHVGVEREAHFLHLAGLVVAQHFTGTADFQIVHGQEEAGPQFFHHLDGFQTLGGVLGDGFLVGNQQVGIGLMV